MSDYEHLIENACCAWEKVRDRELSVMEAYQLFNASPNTDMAIRTGVPIDAVWQMGQYVIFTWDLCK